MRSYLLLVVLATLICGCVDIENTYKTYSPKSYPIVVGDVAVGFSGNVFKVRNVTSTTGTALVYGNNNNHFSNGFYTANAVVIGDSESYEIPTCEAAPIREQLETRGFIIRSSSPKYIIDIEDKYHMCDPEDETTLLDAAMVYWPTLTFAYRSDKTYKYKMKIYDAKSGKVLHSKNYDFNGYIITLKVIPVFYGSMCPGNEYYVQWARLIADDAADYIIAREKKLQKATK